MYASEHTHCDSIKQHKLNGQSSPDQEIHVDTKAVQLDYCCTSLSNSISMLRHSCEGIWHAHTHTHRGKRCHKDEAENEIHLHRLPEE